MAAIAESTPRWVGAVLRWDWTLALARLAIASSYLIGGLDKASDFPAAVAEQAHFGLQPAWLWASVTIVVELGGSLLLIWGRLVWLAAGGLGVLTGVAAFVANNFWTMQGSERFTATNAFFEHLGLIGGLALAAAIVAFRKGNDERLKG
jgi:uncharacterized membrane protein YphA (DoxX/SURF4 family)